MSIHPELQERPLFTIAAEIKRTWKDVNFGAVPYLDAMTELNLITDSYYSDSAHTVVCTFLSNTRTWKGPDAHRIKNELRAMVGLPLAKAPKPSTAKARPVIDQDVDKGERKRQAAVVKAAVMRAIFCPFTGNLMDMRRAVVIQVPGRSFVCEATHWDEVKDAFFAGITPEAAAKVTVLDGRELFTPSGRVR